MQYFVNAQEMKTCDTTTMKAFGIPSMVLMERAALQVVEQLSKADFDLTEVGIICGMGNNGGDGIAVARLLHEKGISVKIILVGNAEHATTDTKQQLKIVNNYQLPVFLINTSDKDNQEYKSVLGELDSCTCLIDSIFGIGLTRDVSGIYREVIEYMNHHKAKKLAVDIPSGIDAGNGQVLGCAVNAHITVTFAFAKAGLLLYPGADYAGQVVVTEIGITEESFLEKKPYLYTYSSKEIRATLPKRLAYSNKGTYGKAVFVVGSSGMAGAAYLAAMAAYRMGCGLVRLVTPEANRVILQQLLPEAILTTYDEEHISKKEIEEALDWGDCIAIGCGLGQSACSKNLLELVLQYKEKPLLIDGDGLNLLAKEPVDLAGYKQPVILTPHLGEMSRLTNQPVAHIQKNLVQTAADYANKNQVCCVLKDARTVVTCGHERAYLNTTGNSGMASAGSGDILAGMICGLLAQGMNSEEASVAAVHLHGCAGDEAARSIGMRGMLARDILDNIPKALSLE